MLFKHLYPMMIQTRLHLLIILLLIPIKPCWAQESQPSQKEAAVIQERKIQPGDTLLYRVVEDKDPLIPLPVSANGTVNLPYIGSISAAGKTAEALATDIQALLESSLYKTATVIIIVEASPGIREIGTVYLSGRVNRVGPIDIDLGKKNTISKVILSVGGFSDFADKRNVRIIRNNPKTNKNERIIVNVESVLEDGKLENDVPIMDGDFIIVPQRLFNW